MEYALSLSLALPPAFLPVPSGFAFPPCLLYIDDSLIAVPLYLDRFCVKLLPTDGPYGRLQGCGLGIPGAWNSLEHRLRDVDRNAKAIGIKLNSIFQDVKRCSLCLKGGLRLYTGLVVHLYV